MDIRPLCPEYAVSPQITPLDVPAIVAAGYTTIVCNRPDGEVPEMVQAQAVQEACTAAGVAFHDNPFDHQAFSLDLIETQKAILDAAPGPVFAYCASGNRCTVLWCFASAPGGDIDALIEAGSAQGYMVEHLRPQLEAYAASCVS